MMKLSVWIWIIFLSTALPWGVGAASVDRTISAHLQYYVADQLSVDASEIEISQIRSMNGALRFLPGQDLKVRASNSRRLLGRVVFILTLQQPGEKPFTQWIHAEVVRVQKAVVAKRRLQRHEIIGKDDLEIQTIRIRRKHQLFETDPDALIGKRMRRSLKKGGVIRLDHVEDAPMIFRGDSITITLKIRGLEITTLGKAAEDGFQGERIKVVNLDSKKIVFGEVIGHGRVRMGDRSDTRE